MTDIHIGSIRVRAEDLTPAQGEVLGARIADLLGEALAEGGGQRDVGLIRIHVAVQGDENVDQLANEVVRAVIGAL